MFLVAIEISDLCVGLSRKISRGSGLKHRFSTFFICVIKQRRTKVEDKIFGFSYHYISPLPKPKGFLLIMVNPNLGFTYTNWHLSLV